MKTRFAILSLAGLAFFTAGEAAAQVFVPTPGNPTKFEKRGTNGGSSVGASMRKREPAKKQVITFTAVSPQRVWTNTDGKGIMARLLAFSAPENPNEGPTEIIRKGKVRLLLEKAKAPIDYSLNKLSQPDQLFVKSIAQAASKRPPAKTKPAEELEKPKPE